MHFNVHDAFLTCRRYERLPGKPFEGSSAPSRSRLTSGVPTIRVKLKAVFSAVRMVPCPKNAYHHGLSAADEAAMQSILADYITSVDARKEEHVKDLIEVRAARMSKFIPPILTSQ